MRYECRSYTVGELTVDQRERMLDILSESFVNVTREEFLDDLHRKDLVFLSTDPQTKAVVGFSTQKILSLRDGSQLVFSGDTIVAPSAWGSLDLPRAWGHWMLELKDQRPDKPLYWLLISKGHRTYRFLSTYFEDFAPSRERTYSPEEEEVIVEAASILFDRGIVKTSLGHYLLPHLEHSQFLAPQLQSQHPRRMLHPEIEFFTRANPDYTKGSELICLLNYSVENMLPFCKRMLRVDEGTRRS